jgi:hypothetical protein
LINHTTSRRALRSAILCASVLLGSQMVATLPALAVGAIAVDDEAGQRAGDAGYGIGHGDTRAAAEHDAMVQCRKAGNDSCKIAVWYKVCGAYAASKSYYGIGYGNTEGAAKHKALENCDNSSCRIAASDCDE